MARKVHASLTASVGLPPCIAHDLASVAQAAESIGALSAFQNQVLLDFPDLTLAEPNYSHEALAVLAAEGAATIVLTNYDDCIERSASPESLPTVVIQQDLAQFAHPLLYKVHGCATRPSTMLASPTQLQSPLAWARDKVRERLGASVVAFVGLGDPPPYVVERLEQLTDVLQQPYVTSPTIRTNWATSRWAQLTPNLDDDRKVEMMADTLLDQILREYLRPRLAGISAALRGRLGADLVDTLNHRGALALVRWLRRATWRWPAGRSVVHSDQAFRAILALAVLSESRQIADGGLASPDALPILTEGASAIQILIAADQPRARDIIDEAHRRSRDARRRGMSHEWGSAKVTVVCSGHFGNLPLLPETRDLVETPEPFDVLDGPEGAALEFVDAYKAIEAIG